ncbi:MAG TPA: outer membrane lipoprotein carrier protein LolA [Alphaproteobacteria bacterium]|nr:outer membrane lipoprotein carrier protein LolA [Alphaproteobacteria bacterium]
MAAALAAGAAQAADAPDGGWSLDALMAGLRQVREASAHFTELKTVHMLTRPIQATGMLKYVAPDKLEKITLTPAPETIRLDGSILTGTRADGEDFSIDIGSHTEIAALVEGIRSTLAGDLPTLQRYYRMAFTGGQDHWQIDLVPKDPWVREKIDRIRILGAGTVISNIVVDEKDGDRSEMAVTPDTPAPHTPASDRP